MARRADQALREEWRKRMHRQQQSGASVAAFCRAEGVAPATFYAWKRRLRAKPAGRTGKAPPRRARAARTPREEIGGAAESWVPFVQLPVSASAASPWIEVVLSEGTVVRVPQQNLAALETVLRTLGGSASAPDAGVVKHA